VVLNLGIYIWGQFTVYYFIETQCATIVLENLKNIKGQIKFFFFFTFFAFYQNFIIVTEAILCQNIN